MKRRHLLAAETFAYSYANYRDHLDVRNIRFTKLMPQDVDALERAEVEGWGIEKLAQALELEPEQAQYLRRAYQEAKHIVDAPTPAEAFRRGVRFSIEHALEQGLNNPSDIEKLVTQICYRAADLAYLLDLQGTPLSHYSRELRKEPGVGYEDLA